MSNPATSLEEVRTDTAALSMVYRHFTHTCNKQTRAHAHAYAHACRRHAHAHCGDLPCHDVIRVRLPCCRVLRRSQGREPVLQCAAANGLAACPCTASHRERCVHQGRNARALCAALPCRPSPSLMQWHPRSSGCPQQTAAPSRGSLSGSERSCGQEGNEAALATNVLPVEASSKAGC